MLEVWQPLISVHKTTLLLHFGEPPLSSPEWCAHLLCVPIPHSVRFAYFDFSGKIPLPKHVV